MEWGALGIILLLASIIYWMTAYQARKISKLQAENKQLRQKRTR